MSKRSAGTRPPRAKPAPTDAETAVDNPVVTVVEPGRVELREHPPAPLGPRQIRVHATYTLISTGTDLTIVSGDFPPDSAWARYASYPVRIGYSHVGEIVEIGAEVTELQLGEKVLTWCAHMRLGTADAAGAVRLPPGLSDQEAAFGVLGEIALGGVRRAALTLGESALVLGLGPVGQLTAQLARLDGARPVIAADLAGWRADLAAACGADHVCRSPAELDATVRELTADGVDAAFDVTGHPSGVNACAPLVRRLGRILLLGSPRGPAQIDLHDHVHSRSLQLVGTHNSAHPRVADPNFPWTIQRDTELFFRLVAAGELRVGPLISHVHPWHEAPRVFADLLADRSQTMGVLLDWRA